VSLPLLDPQALGPLLDEEGAPEPDCRGASEQNRNISSSFLRCSVWHLQRRPGDQPDQVVCGAGDFAPPASRLSVDEEEETRDFQDGSRGGSGDRGDEEHLSSCVPQTSPDWLLKQRRSPSSTAQSGLKDLALAYASADQ
ncbi:unnamed protein product, partial [Tetraodon nigroviridis]